MNDDKYKQPTGELLLRTLRETTDITELTPTLVNALIERIEVHNNDKSSGHCFVKVDIYFTAAGMIDIPTEQEILAMMKEIRENPQDFRFVAEQKNTVQPILLSYTVPLHKNFLIWRWLMRPALLFHFYRNLARRSSGTC